MAASSRGRDRPAFLVFAVGEQDENLVVVALFLINVRRGANGFGDVGPPVRDQADLERVHVLEEGGFVQGQRALQEGAARENDQAEPVGFRLGRQIVGGEFRPGEAVRRDVRRQHAAREIDGDDNIEPVLAGFLPLEAELRAGEAEEQASAAATEQQAQAEAGIRMGHAPR